MHISHNATCICLDLHLAEKTIPASNLSEAYYLLIMNHRDSVMQARDAFRKQCHARTALISITEQKCSLQPRRPQKVEQLGGARQVTIILSRTSTQ